jgi:hypothetical protein
LCCVSFAIEIGLLCFGSHKEIEMNEANHDLLMKHAGCIKVQRKKKKKERGRIPICQAAFGVTPNVVFKN